MVRLLAKSVFFGAVLAGAALTGSGSAWAEYPERPIRVVVSFPAGGAADVLARAIAAPLSKSLNQQVIVDNRPGADGLIAGEAVARAAPDGYTLFFGTSTTLSYAPAIHRAMPFDPVASFTPIGSVSDVSYFLYASGNTSVRSVDDLLVLARAQPRTVNYGSGAASGVLLAALFAQEAKLQMTHVPYKGEAPMLQDLLAGRVQVAFATAGVALAHAREGRLRVIATADAKRNPAVPEVPTLREAGVALRLPIAWTGLFGPAGMPAAAVERISRELRLVLARAETREHFERMGLQPMSLSPLDFGAFVKQQQGAWSAAVEAAGIKPQ
ncbi:Bug family tripartite tricarboxylate transporter substrate binding protein [Ramlibacter sp.]|uniref:Bug family tripartite tricarboxylate transporter substrate binding protein n=1 Tax=Ramlibacter sp. TaxID=1917967 RepID=UPI003D0FDCFD